MTEVVDTNRAGMAMCMSTDLVDEDLNVLYLGRHTIPMTHAEMSRLSHLLHNTLYGMKGYDKDGEYVLMVERKTK